MKSVSFGLKRPHTHEGSTTCSIMADIVVSFGENTELDFQTVDIGTADDGEVLAFTIEGVVKGLDSELLEQFVGKSIVPTEIHFRVEGE